jgi:hypothetical protein
MAKAEPVPETPKGIKTLYCISDGRKWADGRWVCDWCKKTYEEETGQQWFKDKYGTVFHQIEAGSKEAQAVYPAYQYTDQNGRPYLQPGTPRWKMVRNDGTEEKKEGYLPREELEKWAQ